MQMNSEQKNVNWRFLVPLLDLSFPVYQALITSLNHSTFSPRGRMQKFLNYVLDTFDFVDVTDDSSPYYMMQFSYQDLRMYYRKWFGRNSEITFHFPEHRGFAYRYASWSGTEANSKVYQGSDFESFHLHRDGDLFPPAVPSVEFLDEIYAVLIKCSQNFNYSE